MHDILCYQSGVEFFTVPRQGRPSMVSYELVTKIKAILLNLCGSGGVISRNTVISIGNGVLSSRCPEKLTNNGGSVTLTTKWARRILKSLDWVKRCGTATKREMIPVLYEELIFTWKRKITNATFEYSIHYEMVLNFYETPRGFTAPNKATFAEKGAQSAPIFYVNDKREITDTFCVNISGEFLPIQLIYSSCYRLCQEDDFFLP